MDENLWNWKKTHDLSRKEEAMNEWKDMPEFIQAENPAYAKIIFRFQNEEDLQKFSKLIGQSLNKRTKFAWYPKRDKEINYTKRYIDME